MRLWQRALAVPVLSIGCAFPLFAADRQLQLPQHLEQGQLVIGREDVDAAVTQRGDDRQAVAL